MMHSIQKAVELKLDTVEATYRGVEILLRTKTNHLTENDRKLIWNTLLDSYCYLRNHKPWHFGYRRFFHWHRDVEKVMSNPKLMERYNKLVETYATPYWTLGHYIDALEIESIKKHKDTLEIIQAFFLDIDNLRHGLITNSDLEELWATYDSTYNDSLLANPLDPYLNFIKVYKELPWSVERFNQAYLDEEHALQEAYLQESERRHQIRLEKERADELERLERQQERVVNSVVDSFLEETRELQCKFISSRERDALQSKYTPFHTFVKSLQQKELYAKFINTFDDLSSYIDILNDEFVELELERQKTFLSDIDKKSLDEQQQTAVVTDDTNALIIAGAGSGKTLTIAAKVKYLVEIQKVNPEEILLISFTAKSAAEMKERIAGKLGLPVDVKTFHKLGLEIIAKHRNAKPTVIENSSEVIQKFFKQVIYSNPDMMSDMVTFLNCYLKIPTDVLNCKTLGEIIEETDSYDNETIQSKYNVYREQSEIDAMKNQKLTIKKEQVKSIEEAIIANYLFLNGIEYEYERKYEHDTRTSGHREYFPDFYLPDYGIYIEHYGIDKNKRVPWLSPIEEAKYLESYEWKKQLHAEHGTQLIESFSHYNADGLLLSELESNLEYAGVEFKERDKSEIFRALYSDRSNIYFDEIIKLVNSFITLLKSRNMNETDIDRFLMECEDIQNQFKYERTRLLLRIVRGAYLHYQQHLFDYDVIDFNDMINQASDALRQNPTICPPYKYIIIDEFQDTSLGRYNIVQAIRNITQAKLFCVGDDWQSIYRFTGSDVSLFTEFQSFFGSASMLKIENTYRNTQALIDIAGQFVMQNERQIKKTLTSIHHSDETPITIIGYNSDPVDGLKKAIEEIVAKKPDIQEIMLIGRNNFDIKFIEKYTDFKTRRDKDETLHITYTVYPHIDFTFLTAHRSKGLEAEATILLNVNDGIIGFPNKISDDAILEYVLTKKDDFKFGEERRLFYVALTRTKSIAYITTHHHRRSKFVEELVEDYNVPYLYLDNPEFLNEVVLCPRCFSGHLTPRTAGHRKFLGCTHYPQCGYTVSALEVLNNPIPCPVCGGFLVKRKNSKNHSRFLGCTNHPHCKNTQSIRTPEFADYEDAMDFDEFIDE